MQEAKNTARALVRIGYDGTVHKLFRGPKAEERFANELRVLQYLEDRGCEFVPRVLGFDREKLELVTTNCGARVQQIGEEKLQSLFAELEQYGVRHDDPFDRNVTYRATDGRFCVIDFEFATILDEAAAQAAGVDAAVSPQGMRLRWSGACDRGWLRFNNEDRFLAIAFDRQEFAYLAKQGEVSTENFDFVFAVSDGMGGERSGEFASRCALDNITRLLPRRYALLGTHNRSGLYECLEEVFQGTHRQLTTLSESYEEGRNMGATLTMVWYVNGWFYVGHIGDSRIYYLPAGGRLQQITEDHTHVGWLRRQGRLNEREARMHPRKNVLSQALGSGNQFIHPQLDAIEARPGDRLLLCTDGVLEGLWDHALEELLVDPPSHLAVVNPAERIVKTAIAESGRDNATALVVEVLPAGEPDA
jgi:serine/threonine protein phosphatase PrpC